MVSLPQILGRDKSIDGLVERLQRDSNFVPPDIKEAQQQLIFRLYLLNQENHELKGKIGVDTLTGLPNYDRFAEDLPRNVAQASRTGEYLSLLFIDGDRFKYYNDNYSHEVGNVVVSAFGRLLSEILRFEEKPYRYGGDEFVVIVDENCKPKDALKLGRRLCKNLKGGLRGYVETTLTEPKYAETKRKLMNESAADGRLKYDCLMEDVAGVNVSCGLSTKEIPKIRDISTRDMIITDLAQSLIETADGYLHQAKDNGRNRIVYYGGQIELK